MRPGQWVSDDDLTAATGCRVEATGARRRELKNFGYVIESR
jgi:hypothetical protein